MDQYCATVCVNLLLQWQWHNSSRHKPLLTKAMTHRLLGLLLLYVCVDFVRGRRQGSGHKPRFINSFS